MIIPMSGQIAYRIGLREVAQKYMGPDTPPEMQRLLAAVYTDGWTDAKKHTIEVIETMTENAPENGEGNDNEPE